MRAACEDPSRRGGVKIRPAVPHGPRHRQLRQRLGCRHRVYFVDEQAEAAAQIENRAGGGIGGALLNAANKFKYWDLYKDVYSILANRAADEMPQAFLDELATAYADEIAKHAPKSQSGATSKEAG